MWEWKATCNSKCIGGQRSIQCGFASVDSAVLCFRPAVPLRRPDTGLGSGFLVCQSSLNQLGGFFIQWFQRRSHRSIAWGSLEVLEQARGCHESRDFAPWPLPVAFSPSVARVGCPDCCLTRMAHGGHNDLADICAQCVLCKLRLSLAALISRSAARAGTRERRIPKMMPLLRWAM